jgi:hypothetical protein
MIAAGDKRRPPLEPGMRTMLRWMAVVYVCMAPLIQILGTFFANTPAPSVTVILLSLVVPLLLFAYVWMPRWEPIMGQAFVPVALLLIMINVLVPRTFVLIQTGPAGLESTFVLYGMLRTWMTMSLLVTALACRNAGFLDGGWALEPAFRSFRPHGACFVGGSLGDTAGLAVDAVLGRPVGGGTAPPPTR